MNEEEKKHEDVVEDTTYEEKERKETVEDNTPKRDALVTCRILFISILDKIYIIILLLTLLISTYTNFNGDMSSLSYGFWGRVGREIVTLIGIVIAYFIYNWFYKCFAKTMLCVTEKEIYKETYLPFIRHETTIPLNKVTSVSSYKFLWIFRSVIIFQYLKLPMVFFTWNNQEFKDKVEELLTNDKTKVKNQFESKNIINKEQYKFVAICGGALVAIIVLLGIIRFFGYTFSDERHLPGVYKYKDNSIELVKDGTCELKLSGVSNVKSCEWKYDSDHKRVDIDYKYEYKGYYSFYTSEYESSIEADYDNKTLTYDGYKFEKE